MIKFNFEENGALTIQKDGIDIDVNFFRGKVQELEYNVKNAIAKIIEANNEQKSNTGVIDGIIDLNLILGLGDKSETFQYITRYLDEVTNKFDISEFGNDYQGMMEELSEFNAKMFENSSKLFFKKGYPEIHTNISSCDDWSFNPGDFWYGIEYTYFVVDEEKLNSVANMLMKSSITSMFRLILDEVWKVKTNSSLTRSFKAPTCQNIRLYLDGRIDLGLLYEFTFNDNCKI